MNDAPRILLVEDEYFIAIDVASCLKKWGYEVLGPVATVAQALQLIETHVPAAAILDIQLVGELSYPLAHKLMSLGIPFLFRSGHSDCDLPVDMQRFPLVSKLTEPSELQQALDKLLKPDHAV